jgi:hypothetical protein
LVTGGRPDDLVQTTATNNTASEKLGKVTTTKEVTQVQALSTNKSTNTSSVADDNNVVTTDKTVVGTTNKAVSTSKERRVDTTEDLVTTDLALGGTGVGTALIELLRALLGTTGKLTTIDGVEALVVLDVARADQGSGLVGECGAVDLEGTVGITVVLDSRGSTTESTSEGLEVATGSGTVISVLVVIGSFVVLVLILVVGVLSGLGLSGGSNSSAFSGSGNVAQDGRGVLSHDSGGLVSTDSDGNERALASGLGISGGSGRDNNLALIGNSRGSGRSLGGGSLDGTGTSIRSSNSATRARSELSKVKLISDIGNVEVGKVDEVSGEDTTSTSEGLLHVGNGRGNFFLSGVENKELLGVDAAKLKVNIVASETSASVVVHITRRERASEKGKVGVSAEGGELAGELKSNGLVDGQSVVGGSILVRDESANLRVDSRLIAQNAGDTNTTGVTLDGLEHQRTSHTTDVADSLRVGEGLVGGSLLKTVKVGDIAGTLLSSSVTKKTKDGILDVEGVLELHELIGNAENDTVRLLLRDLTLVDRGALGDGGSGSQAEHGTSRGDGGELHIEGFWGFFELKRLFKNRLS